MARYWPPCSGAAKSWPMLSALERMARRPLRELIKIGLGTVMKDVFERIKRALDNGEKGVVVTITRTSGSTPRQPGARMILLASGETVGTVGGGCVEGDIVRAARNVLRSGQPQQLRQTVGTDSQGSDASAAPAAPEAGVTELFLEPIECWR